jgi:hypothetical protein
VVATHDASPTIALRQPGCRGWSHATCRCSQTRRQSNEGTRDPFEAGFGAGAGVACGAA